MAQELEQFLGRGDEIVFSIFTYKNAGGAVIGGFVGSRFAEMAGASGLVVFLGILIGIIIGLWITWNSRGLLRLRRWIVTLRFYLRRAVQRERVINASELYEVIELRNQPIIIRRDGQTLIAPKE